MTPALQAAAQPGVGSTPLVPPSARLTVPCDWGPVPVPGPSRPPGWSRARPPAPAHTETTRRGCNRHGSGETRETGVWVAGLAARQMGGWDRTATPPWRPQVGREGSGLPWARPEKRVSQRGGVASRQVRRPGPTGSGLPGALGSEADWLTNDMTTASRWRVASWHGGRPTQRHTGKEDPVRARGRKDPERARERAKTSCAGPVEMKAEGPQRAGAGRWDGEGGARLTHGTQTRGRARSESETQDRAFFPLPCLWRTYVS